MNKYKNSCSDKTLNKAECKVDRLHCSNEARPELLWGVGDSTSEKAEGKLSYKKTIIALAVAALLCGGVVSLAASAFPDGLEWSMEKVAGTTELEAEGGAYDAAAGIQETTSLLPDYAFKNSESVAGTSFSGIVGSLVVVAVSVGACYAFRFFKKKAE